MKMLKQLLEMTDPLKDLDIEMFFRQELRLSKVEAVEARLWVQHVKDAADLNGDTWEKIQEYVANNTTNDNFYRLPPPRDEEYADEFVARVMYDKYGIEL